MNAKWWSAFVENYRRVLKCQQLLVTVESSRERKRILTTKKKRKKRKFDERKEGEGKESKKRWKQPNEQTKQLKMKQKGKCAIMKMQIPR